MTTEGRRDALVALPEPWRSRVGRATATILGNRPSPMVQYQIEAVERSLAEAADDLERLATAAGTLDPATAAAELKAALRSTDASETLVASLRRRHESINDLLNRRDGLQQRVEATVADLETLAIRTSTIGLGDDGDDRARRELEQLHLDVELLAEAHRELDQLSPDPAQEG